MKLSSRQIEVFQAVMESNTLSDAAERLHIGQPSVSRILARFEHLAGFKAFEHRGRRLIPTESAKIFHQEVLRIQRGIDYLNKVAAEIGNSRRGHVSIAVLPALSNSWIVAEILAFTTRYPEIHLSVVGRASRDIVESVDTQRVDLGISLFASESGTIDCRQFLGLEIVCVLPRSHPLARKRVVRLSDLQQERLIGLTNAELGPVPSQRGLIEAEGMSDVHIKISSAAAVCRLVAANQGVSVVPEIVAREHEHLNIAIRPLEPRRSQPVYLLKSRHRAYSPLVEILAEQIASKKHARA